MDYASSSAMRLENHLTVEPRALTSLKPYSRNPRHHSKHQIGQIARSIREFGFTNPILIDEAGEIIAGHGRFQAAKELGLETVPVLALTGLTVAQIRALRIADNKLAENATWTPEFLAHELNLIIEDTFDVSLTGFETAEIDLVIESLDKDSDDQIMETVSEPDRTLMPVTEVGDLWQCGVHRLLCADATGRDAYEALLDGELAQMVFTDPPYNVPIDRHVCGLGKARHREFVMASGEMSDAEYRQFLKLGCGHLAASSIDGAIHFICMDWRHAHDLQTATDGIYHELKNICVWNKTNGGMGSLYRSKHEFVFVFKSGTGPHINNVELGRYGRSRSNVWDYPGVNTFKPGRNEELAIHPTVKPVALVADAIRDCSKRDGIILDAFAGSGTTLFAAEQTGRRGYAIELDPHYVDAVVRRWQDNTGETVIHANTGASFQERADRRGVAPGTAVQTGHAPNPSGEAVQDD